MAFDESVVVHTEVVVERWLQSGITHGDVLRVAVVGDVEQISHRRLRCCSTIGGSQFCHVVGCVAQIQCWGEVHHVPRRVGVYALIVLLEVGRLRLQHHACVQLVFFADETQHDVHFVDVVVILRKAAQVVVQIVAERSVHLRQERVPASELLLHAPEDVGGQVAEVVCGAVALVITVFKLITELQIGAVEDRFAVCGLHSITPVFGGCQVVAVGIIGGVSACC